MEVYGLTKSRSGRVLWALEEAGIAYAYKALDFRKGEQRDPSFLKLNAAAKVPTLVDGDLVLTESGAILNYIANAYAPSLMPQQAKAKADYDRWCYFALTELEQGLWLISKHLFALPPEQRVKEVIPTGAWEYQKALAIFSEGLADHDYILSSGFSMADILLGHTLAWGVMAKQPLPQPNLQAYLKRCQQRAAFQRMLEVEQQSS